HGHDGDRPSRRGVAMTTRPLPPRVHARRDLIVDGEETIDVTHVSDRDLVLRAVNSTLKTEHALGQVALELSGLATKIGAHELTLAGHSTTLGEHTKALKTLGVRVEKTEGEIREKVPSAHDLSEATRELVDLVEDVKEEITGRHHISKPPTLTRE